MGKYVLPLVDWGNGIIMIGVFAAVVVVLIVMLINLMNSGKKE